MMVHDVFAYCFFNIMTFYILSQAWIKTFEVQGQMDGQGPFNISVYELDISATQVTIYVCRLYLPISSRLHFT